MTPMESSFAESIQRYAECLGICSEDVRNIFEAVIDESYDGRIGDFLDDLAAGFVVTEVGKAEPISYFDYKMAQNEG